MLPLQGSLLQVWPNGQDLVHLPAGSPKQVLGRGSMPEFKEQKERKAMEQTVPQSLASGDFWSECSEKGLFSFGHSATCLRNHSNVGVRFLQDSRSPSSEAAISAHLPTLALSGCRRLCLLATYFFPSFPQYYFFLRQTNRKQMMVSRMRW